jgi:hypothetical protein
VDNRAWEHVVEIRSGLVLAQRRRTWRGSHLVNGDCRGLTAPHRIDKF